MASGPGGNGRNPLGARNTFSHTTGGVRRNKFGGAIRRAPGQSVLDGSAIALLRKQETRAKVQQVLRQMGRDVAALRSNPTALRLLRVQLMMPHGYVKKPRGTRCNPARRSRRSLCFRGYGADSLATGLLGAPLLQKLGTQPRTVAFHMAAQHCQPAAAPQLSWRDGEAARGQGESSRNEGGGDLQRAACLGQRPWRRTWASTCRCSSATA